jgi:N-acylneuraminate cytidylyltransferase
MEKKISVFLPTRKGSQRVKSKNTRPFANLDGGLLKLKLTQLLNAEFVDEVILSTNDEISFDIAHRYFSGSNKLKLIRRPEYLAKDETNLTDLIQYVPNICSHHHILWTHVTSPFNESSDYDAAIQMYFKGLDEGYDSLMSVKPFKNFLWDSKHKDIINRGESNNRWPRTQDLKVLYEINSAIFISTKKVYTETQDRIGLKPYLLEQSSIKSFDIDWESDFQLAEIIYEKQIIKKKQK